MLGKHYGGLATKPSVQDVLFTWRQVMEPAFINAVKWANIDCDLTWFMASNVVHSTCIQKATHLLI